MTPYQAQHKYRPRLLTYWAAITRGNRLPMSWANPGPWAADRAVRPIPREGLKGGQNPPPARGRERFRSCDAPWEASTALLQRFAVLGQVETFDLMLLAHP